MSNTPRKSATKDKHRELLLRQLRTLDQLAEMGMNAARAMSRRASLPGALSESNDLSIAFANAAEEVCACIEQSAKISRQLRAYDQAVQARQARHQAAMEQAAKRLREMAAGDNVRLIRPPSSIN